MDAKLARMDFNGFVMCQLGYTELYFPEFILLFVST